ncbi:MAG: cobalamin-dependent protein [Deltaproteobacteria bacterium]|nr:cobalamin-dependent protein [Deltaproteobacteria bacterium]
MSEHRPFKVLLINPPYPFEETPTLPFGLASLAGYLREQKIDVRIEDYIVMPYSIDKVEKILADYKPDIVGATAVTMNVKTALKILADYKKTNPRLITVMGGPHVTFDAEAVLSEHPYVDYVVRGEGELTFHEMVQRLEQHASVDDVLGISYQKDGKVIHNARRPLIEDINILPYPARDLLPISKYKALSFVLSLSTSRGCPYSCIFCVGQRMVGHKVRYFSVKRVVDEFEMLAKHGFLRINIVDDLFTANKKRCMEICDEIVRRGIKQEWAAFARVDTLSRPLLAKLKKAGCVSLCFGIESGCQEILNTIKKKITLEKCREAVAMCREAGLDPMCSYIMGLPGETPETVRESMEFAASLCENYGFHILSPFPGTEVRDRHEEYGIRILTNDWDRYDANQAVSETAYISHDEIDRIVKNFGKKYIDELVDNLNRHERGEEVAEKYKESIKHLNNFVFVRDMIMNEYVDHFNGSANGFPPAEAVNTFAAYIASHSKYNKEVALAQLNRLLAMRCIDVRRDEQGTSIVWA